jgi:solute carrier family 25 2-oxodicarboxylate transporter 21
MYPTDVMKTRAQLSVSKLSMADCCRQIVRNEGWGTFYRGITAPIIAEAPKRAIKFSSNEIYKTWFRSHDGKLSSFGAAAAGTLAGASECILNCPFEVVKVRMQAPENRALYSSTLDCFSKIVRSEGLFRGLYKGFESQVWRNGVWSGTYFGIIGTVRNVAPVKQDASASDKILHNMITGSVAGAVASTVNTPVRTVIFAYAFCAT